MDEVVDVVDDHPSHVFRIVQVITLQSKHIHTDKNITVTSTESLFSRNEPPAVPAITSAKDQFLQFLPVACVYRDRNNTCVHLFLMN